MLDVQPSDRLVHGALYHRIAKLKRLLLCRAQDNYLPACFRLTASSLQELQPFDNSLKNTDQPLTQISGHNRATRRPILPGVVPTRVSRHRGLEGNASMLPEHSW
jgi:hypothetical protein